MAQSKKRTKPGTVSLLLALLLALLPYAQSSAQVSQVITVTMTGAYEISLNVSPADWDPANGGTITPNAEYATDPADFTLSVGGNCAVYTYISASNATWMRNGKVDKSYQWNLSEDGQNGVRTYVLWFKLYDGESYSLITSTPTEFYSGTLGPGDAKQFGLKLLTPQPDFTRNGAAYFSVGNATMQARVIISAVVATT